MFTYVYSSLITYLCLLIVPMFTRVYLFTRVDLYLARFIRVYLHLIAFSNVFQSLLMLTYVYPSLLVFTYI